MAIFPSLIVMLLSALAAGMEEEVNGMSMDRLEQVESQNIERSEPHIRKSCYVNSPQMTPVKSTFRAKTPLSLKNSYERSAMRSFSDCNCEDGNALTSGRLLTPNSGTLTNARSRHLKKKRKIRGHDENENSYQDNRVRSFPQSSSVSHDSPSYDGHHVPNRAHAGQPAHGSTSFTSSGHLSGTSALLFSQGNPFLANQPSGPFILESHHFSSPINHTRLNPYPTNQHHPPLPKTLSRPVVAHSTVGFADQHGHAISQHHRSAKDKQCSKKLAVRLLILHLSIPNTIINTSTPVQDALSALISKVNPAVHIPAFQLVHLHVTKKLTSHEILQPHPPYLMHCALRSRIPVILSAK